MSDITNSGGEIENGNQDNNMDTVKRVINDVFRHSGVKLSPDDPIIQLVVAIGKITDDKAIYIANNLEANAENITDNLMLKQQQVTDAFDSKLHELQALLSKLESQKEVIVADVYAKLQQRITEQIEEQLSRDLQAIANNSNNKVNNERNLLKGAVLGLIIGIVLCAFLFYLVGFIR